jgi:hypothetical protein
LNAFNFVALSTLTEFRERRQRAVLGSGSDNAQVTGVDEY